MTPSECELRYPSLQIILEDEKSDHRRRRRNRMRESCLNCYISKRKCDKKRPCGRCVRLGTTGLCVYEVEDRNSRGDADINEIKRLRHRIAELESLVRELKNNPHPRWTAPGGVVHDPEFLSSHCRSTSQAHGRSDRYDKTRTSTKAEQEENSVASEAVDRVARYLIVRPDPPIPGRSEIISSNTIVHDPAQASSESSPRPCSALTSGPFESKPQLPRRTRYSSDVALSTLPSGTPSESQPLGASLNLDWRAPCVPSTPAISSFSQSPKNIEATCNCLQATVAFQPLVHLGVALRVSREALQCLHAGSSDCTLFCRIAALEKHIFSASPHKERPDAIPSSHLNTGSPCAYPTLNGNVASCLPPKNSQPHATPYPHSHFAPSYPSHRQNKAGSRQHGPFAYLSDIY